jgi:signal transduction histidine kinase/CHASE3 domain sensor protein
MRSWEPQNKLAAGLTLVLALLIVNAGVSFYNLRRVIADSVLVAHTHETLAELHDFLYAVQEIETAQRSYVITGEAQYLQPYNAAVARVPRHLQRLRTLAVAPRLRQQLPGLEREIRERLATSQRIVDARRDNDFEAARRLLQSGLGAREIDNIRRTLASMIAEEDQLLLSRNKESRASASGALFNFGLTSLLSLVLLGLAYMLVARDGMRQRKLAADLKTIEGYSQNIVDTVREPLLMLDPTLRVRSANRAFYKTYHVSPQETEDHLIYELGNGQWDIPALRTLLEDIIPQKSVFNDYELEHDFPDIGRRVMLLNARELRAGNHADLLVLALEDVTERRRAERLLAEIESYAQNIVDTMREPLLMLDTTLRVRSANRAFYQMFRVAPEETENRLIYELGNGQWDIPALRTLLEEIIPTSSVFNDYELEHDFPVIGRRVMLLNARRLRAGIDTEILVLAMEDVTERRRVHELELRFTQELQESYKRLQELEKMRDDLTGMIIHDLRTPLTSVISGMQTLEAVGDLNADQHEMMEIAIAGGETLLGMINDLLDVEKMESGTIQLEYSALDATGLINGAIAQVASLAEGKRLTLIKQIASDLPPFQGDAGKLTRTLVNLLGNAIKFTPSGGAITVAARRSEEGNSVVFAVTDTGEGIPAESFERIFEKFGQVENRKAGRMMSTGLGLTFCKLAVEAHGGHIAVESTPGQGATFCYAIPIAATPS